MVQCPFCKLDVTPTKNAAGQMVCPRCNNTGKASFVPTPATWAPSAIAPTIEELPGATASLVCGILGIVPWAGFVLAIIAIVMGSKALRLDRENPGRYVGASKARVGRILGIVFVAIIPVMVILAAVVFVLVSNLSRGNNTTASPIILGP